MAGGAEKYGRDSDHMRSGGSAGKFLAILVFQLVLTTFVTFPQKKTSCKIARKSFPSHKNDDLCPILPPIYFLYRFTLISKMIHIASEMAEFSQLAQELPL